MKFLYQYRTPDNEKHDGTICAADKEAAYSALKKQGIKPCRFEEAPGLFNKVFGKGKRWIVIGVLGALCLVLFVATLAFRRENTDLHSSLITLNSSLDDATRRQVIGDLAVIEKGVRTGWSDVFDLEGERFLASYAVPGVPPAVASTSEEELKKALDHSSLITPRSSLESASLEARQIRAMVEGMKDELREYLSAGGNVKGYGNRLVRRQQQELGYYSRVKNEIDAAVKSGIKGDALVELWEKRNATLRAMGIKLVAMPNEADIPLQ